MNEVLNIVSQLVSWLIGALSFIKNIIPSVIKDNLLILIIVFAILGWYLASKIYAAKISQTNLTIILTVLMFLVFVLL